MSGSKEKLKIYQCDSSNKRIESKVFEAMINPASYKTTSKISYVKTEGPGPEKEPKFERVYEDTFQFKEIILDGTGVVAMNSSERKSVLEQIAC